MQIHLFISKKAQTGNRLKAALSDALKTNPVIQYNAPNAFGSVIPAAYDVPAIAVIMVSEHEELAELAEMRGVWDRFKTILVIPNGEPETIRLADQLHPIFLTCMSSDFAEVATILDHIKKDFELQRLAS